MEERKGQSGEKGKFITLVETSFCVWSNGHSKLLKKKGRTGIGTLLFEDLTNSGQSL